MLSKLAITSLVSGLVPGLYTVTTLVSLLVLYLNERINNFTNGVLGLLYGFSIMWAYINVWILIIFISIASIISIVCGNIDLVKNKSGLSDNIRQKFDIVGIILAVSPVIIIGLFFTPGISSLISDIPG